MPSPILCPICNATAHRLDHTGDADGFRCGIHDSFKVARSVFAEQAAKRWTREEWEAALLKAKAGTKPGDWPTITTYHFPR